MKRYLILLVILIILPRGVLAKNSFEFTSVTDKCHIVSRNTTEIPINVVVLNDGVISKLIKQNKFGMIENISDYEYEIVKLKSDIVDNVVIDTLRDGNNNSNIYYSVSNDAPVKRKDIIASFGIRIEFNGEYPSTLNILGNEIVLGDKKMCEEINGYKTEVSNREVNKYVEDNVNYVAFVVVSLALLLTAIFILTTVIMRKDEDRKMRR